MKNEELIELLNQADPKDLLRCLKENFSAEEPSRHYNMLAELYYNDKAHYKCLSAGCKAALIIYLGIGK